MKKLAIVLALLLPAALFAQERVDDSVIARIKAEAFQRSAVMDTLSWIADVYGPRLTGSPTLRQAGEWARDQMTCWGLANAALEPDGSTSRGWSIDRFSIEMTSRSTCGSPATPAPGRRRWPPRSAARRSLNTGGTDHMPFDAIGLPGFQFIQDPLNYESKVHHSSLDLYGEAVPDDLKQASAILASFVYNAAMRDAMLPRKPLRAPHPDPK